MNRSKSLIFIGGSRLQLPALRWARELGLRVVLTDRGEDPPGAALADEHHRLDGNDAAGICELARALEAQSELVGAYGGSDFALPAVALVAETFGLPGCGVKSVERTLDKAKARAVWTRAELPLPEGVSVHDEAELVAARERTGLPLIVKPLTGSGSKGVRSVYRDGDLHDAYGAARAHSEKVLVEALVTGRHVDVNGLFVGGGFHPCGILDRHFSEPPYAYPIWGYQPGSLSPAQEERCYLLLEEAARALGILSGPVKADIIWTHAGPVLLEIAPRFHGDVSTAHVTPRATGANPIRAWLAHLAGDPDWTRNLTTSGSGVAGWMGLFPDRAGVLREIHGAETVTALPGIFDLFLRVRVGQMIKRAEDNTSLLGFLWGEAPSAAELQIRLNTARRHLRFVFD